MEPRLPSSGADQIGFSQKIWLFKGSGHLEVRSASGAQNNELAEARLFDVAIISLAADVDEIITDIYLMLS